MLPLSPYLYYPRLRGVGHICIFIATVELFGAEGMPIDYDLASCGVYTVTSQRIFEPIIDGRRHGYNSLLVI